MRDTPILTYDVGTYTTYTLKTVVTGTTTFVICESGGIFIMETDKATYVAVWPKRLRGTRTILNRVSTCSSNFIVDKFKARDVDDLDMPYVRDKVADTFKIFQKLLLEMV